MAAMANIVAYNDASTPVAMTFVPVTDTPDAFWRESNSTASQLAKWRMTQSMALQKNGIERRVVKLEAPIMEQATGAAADGNVAPPKVAHTIVGQVSLFVHNRATEAQVADVLKRLLVSVLGDATAGTGSAYLNATNPHREFLIKQVQAN